MNWIAIITRIVVDPKVRGIIKNAAKALIARKGLDDSITEDSALKEIIPGNSYILIIPNHMTDTERGVLESRLMNNLGIRLSVVDGMK